MNGPDNVKEGDLYDIILDGFIEVLKLHDVTEVSIPNELTISVARKCLGEIKKENQND